MKQQFILYAKTTPFAGYIKSWGIVDYTRPANGSTMAEHVQARMAADADLGLHLFDSPVDISQGFVESYKWDEAAGAMVALGAGDITPAAAKALAESAKAQAFIDNLPSWDQVNTAVTNISSLAEAKTFIRRLARVVYWLAKNTEA